MRPYSIAVAPDSSLANFATNLVMLKLLIHVVTFTADRQTCFLVARINARYRAAISKRLKYRVNKVFSSPALDGG
jgi:hypothetical protein